MIVTTTNNIEGHSIREYCGIVFGEVITGVNMFRDIGAGPARHIRRPQPGL